MLRPHVCTSFRSVPDFLLRTLEWHFTTLERKGLPTARLQRRINLNERYFERYMQAATTQAVRVH